MGVLEQEGLWQQVLQAVEQAGALLRDRAGLHQIRAKGETDFVTNLDLAVQEVLRDRLARLTPQVQFMGEEQDNSALDPGRPRWILDPVDGTTNLIHDFHHSAISLALAEEGQVTAGVVYQPYSGECFTARRGEGAWCGGRPIQVSGARRLRESLVILGTSPSRRDLEEQVDGQFRQLYGACQDVRRTGCASLDLCWVACGRADGFTELFLQPWDYAAGLLVVEQAGGRVTTQSGGRPGLERGGSLLASNGHIHAALEQLLA